MPIFDKPIIEFETYCSNCNCSMDSEIEIESSSKHRFHQAIFIGFCEKCKEEIETEFLWTGKEEMEDEIESLREQIEDLEIENKILVEQLEKIIKEKGKFNENK